MQYRIFPAIGIARIGNSTDFFIGPEVVGSVGRELATAAEVTQFKDAQFRVRKQAARFHVFQRADNQSPWVSLDSTATVKWTVTVANEKDAIVRPGSPLDPDRSQPGLVVRPTRDPARQNRQISASATIASDAGVQASQPLDGTHAGSTVRLGEVRVDASGRLLFLAGDMVSVSHPQTALTGFFYNNPNWCDDVCDGTVTAEVSLPGSDPVTADGAWVVTTPPDFAPGAWAMVTLFVEILQVALDNGWTSLPATPSFTADIYPILRAARSLGWVHIDSSQLPAITNQQNWVNVSQDYAQLSTPGAATQMLRQDNRDLVTNVQTLQLLSNYTIPDWMRTYLDQWAAGTFTADWNGVPTPAPQFTAESLTKAALSRAVGQGFFPGIEAGRILLDPSIYAQPFDFRINPAVLSPGDVTALMAQPWQADFLKCADGWWPSQRPDLAPAAGNTFVRWARLSQGTLDHAAMVAHVGQFGMITVAVDGQGVQVSAAEQGRDPAA
ncbi:MAG TPA: LodA/GoxA family CTQ-dependent oxidase [Chloroflexota bacterium]|jgi:hypothetical protein|nr:LodA/GoxA family CTQ-dependent oxidase [Chloroflexota bacterium]